MKKKTQLSPAMELLTLVWEETPRGSWDRLNQSMKVAMRLAITAKMLFALDDFATARRVFRGGYWFGVPMGEMFYSLAVETGNLSAAQSFEAWTDRPPFIADRVDHRKRGRLAIGSTFQWRGETVAVTSFAEDGSYLTACTYRDRDTETYRRKIKNRYTITEAGIREERRESAERTQLYARLNKVVDNNPPRKLTQQLKRIGIVTEKDWFVAPVEDLRAVVKEWEAKEETD